jgi:4-hydroxy-tetrahydrodipicolinate reductase
VASSRYAQQIVTRICVAGATGWTGRALSKAILDDPTLELVAAVARRTAGQDLGEVLGIGVIGLQVVGSVEEALQSPCDVLVDYTSHMPCGRTSIWRSRARSPV